MSQQGRQGHAVSAASPFSATLPPSLTARSIPLVVPLLLVEIDGFMEPFDDVQTFPTSGYAENILRYSGPYRFNKHYFDLPRDLNPSARSSATRRP